MVKMHITYVIWEISPEGRLTKPNFYGSVSLNRTYDTEEDAIERLREEFTSWESQSRYVILKEYDFYDA